MNQIPCSGAASIWAMGVTMEMLCKLNTGANLVLVWMLLSNQGCIYPGEPGSVRENRFNHLARLLIPFVMGNRLDGQLLSFP